MQGDDLATAPTASEAASFDAQECRIDLGQDQPGGSSQGRVDLSSNRVKGRSAGGVEARQLVETEGSLLVQDLRHVGNEGGRQRRRRSRPVLTLRRLGRRRLRAGPRGALVPPGSRSGGASAPPFTTA
jgi:hypothetical protein